MKFRVTTIRRADSDIGQITSYIHQRSSKGAAAWIKALDVARSRLAFDAEGCGEAEENEYFDIKVQQSLFKTRRGRVYRLLFTIVGDEVRILRVRGPGQASVEPTDI